MYTKQDYQKCIFNPMVKDLLKEYELSEWADVISHEKANEIAKYIVAIYDPSSPLIKNFPDTNKRKDWAADFFKVDDVDGLKDFSVEKFAMATHWFLRNFIRSMDWAIIQANTETFWEYQLRLMKPIGADENTREKELISAIQVKSKLAEDLSIIAERITKHTKAFYGDDVDLIDTAKKLKFTSEGLANVFENH